MSRVPSSRPTVKTTLVPPRARSRAPSPSKPSTSAVVSPSTPRVRTKSIPKSPSKSTRRPPPEEEIPQTPKAPLSVKEAIALKRAEAKKAAARPVVSNGGLGFDSLDTLEESGFGRGPTKKEKEVDENADLGRWSVKEAIERARSTGSINLSSRSLPCLPSALFEIHLGIKPDALKSVGQEPPIGCSDAPGKRPGQRGGPAWFEAQDLQVLKAWNNEIVEIQHEISLFGSLKSVDLHQNKICALPNTFADLTALTSLDLSHNSLASLPLNVFALPSLSILNLSHNALTTLPFGEPFSGASRSSRTDTYSSGGFFGPVIIRANVPLPRLVSLDVSFNKLSASAIDHKNLPSGLSKVDLSSNPIASDFSALLRAFGGLSQLKELRLANTDIDDDAFPSTLLTGEASRSFSSLRILDLEETRANAEAVALAFTGLKQSLNFDMTTEELPEGTLRITVGKKVLKEAWELEAERRTRHRSGRSLGISDANTDVPDRSSQEEPLKEPWEIEADQGLLTEGGRRRARAAAAAAAATESSVGTANVSTTQEKRSSVTGLGHPSSPPPQGALPSFNLNNPQYYDATTQTLKLPPSAPLAKLHARSFSLATSATARATPGKSDIALPTPSLPIATISSQSFTQSLKILVLSNRKLDLSVSLPSCEPEMDAELIPTLEELVLDGCGFPDTVTVTRHVPGGATPIKSSEPLLSLLTRLFPNLRTLDVSYNALTSAALQKDVLMALMMASAGRAALKHLRLRGNRITTLDGFQQMAEIFKGHRSVPDWNLEELDLRDNEIAKLPSELGLLPLDVFLVDGNVFRIPQRRIWEREGTKGLLSWLRGRIE